MNLWIKYLSKRLNHVWLTLQWRYFLVQCFIKKAFGKAVNIGVIGEFHARIYLQQQGLEFVAANWRCRGGEIDLIMRHPIDKNDNKYSHDRVFLVFIEVKTRQLNSLVSAEESVNAQKQRRLIHAANNYLQHINNEPYCRFDVVSVDKHNNESTHIRQWIQGAFESF